MKSYKRMLRLEEDLEKLMATLPYGTGNSLINQLLKIYFKDSALRKKISLKDDRFAEYRGPKIPRAPIQHVQIEDVSDEDQVAPAPDKVHTPARDPQPPPGIGITVETVENPTSLIDEILPDK